MRNVVILLLFVGLLTGCMSETAGKKVVGARQDTHPQTDAPDIPYASWTDPSFSVSNEDLSRSKIPYHVKGIYLTRFSAGGARFDKLLSLLDDTELNAMVIDYKDDFGLLTYPTQVKMARDIGSDRQVTVKDVRKQMETLRQHGVYPIARIVTFKDPFLPVAYPELALQKKTGGVWRDRNGVAWVDPYNPGVWQYVIDIAKEAARAGFKEIQFDYVRFPENGKKVDAEVAYYQPNGRTKADVIAEFLAYAKKELEPYHVFVSADVFGLTTSVTDDMGIGQKWEKIISIVDYISPMMYPSHYANHTYGLSVPDRYPYETIKNGLTDALGKNEALLQTGANLAIIRPWYQDFTATWVPGHISYGAAQVKLQIKAGEELGIDQFILWNANNTYSESAFRP